MTLQTPIAPVPPAAIGQYPVLLCLTPGQSYLALDAAGRKVVIKMLDGDCLLRGKLHPNIRDRLARVRELAHTGVANLHGVERAADRAFAVWEYLPGITLDRHAAHLQSPQTLTRLARELILAVESLHVLGIVHGRLHAGNVIIDDLGQIHLTHVSPLLYDDPAVDAHDLAILIGLLATQRGWNDSPPLRLPDDSLSLPQLRARLSFGSDAPSPASPQTHHFPAGPRWRSFAAAVAVTFLAAIFAIALIRTAWRTSPQPPVPPQAPPAALRDAS